MYDASKMEYSFYQVVSKPDEDDKVKVRKVVVGQTKLGLEKILKLPWGAVGVYAFVAVGAPLPEAISTSKIAGKAIRVNTLKARYIISVPVEVLRDA